MFLEWSIQGTCLVFAFFFLKQDQVLLKADNSCSYEVLDMAVTFLHTPTCALGGHFNALLEGETGRWHFGF